MLRQMRRPVRPKSPEQEPTCVQGKWVWLNVKPRSPARDRRTSLARMATAMRAFLAHKGRHT
jgi:hypothetical protein